MGVFKKIGDWTDKHSDGIFWGAVVTDIAVHGANFVFNMVEKKKVEKRKAQLEEYSKTRNVEADAAWSEEDYRESWDAVNKLAKTLKMKPGERYIIAKALYYEAPDYIEVEHYVDFTPCNPPKEES